jgi:hypothetical protein
MANLKVVLEIDNQGYIRGIKAAESATDSFSKSAVDGANAAGAGFTKLTGVTDRLVTGMTKLKAVLIGGAFAAFAKNSIAAADSIADLAKATELTIPKILELEAALEGSGGKAVNAGKLITEFYKSIEEAAGGSDKTQEAFGRLGISLDDLAKLSTADLMDKAMKGFENVGSSSEKTALAIQIFGKSMMGVSPADFASEMERLRGTFDENAAAVQRAADLNQQWEATVVKLRLAFLEAFGPILAGMAKMLENLPSLIILFKALGAVIVGIFIATGLRTFISLLGMAGRGVSALVSGFEKLRSMGGLGKALGGAANNKGIASLRDTATAVGLAGGTVAAGVAMYGGGEEPTPGTSTAGAGNASRAVQAGKELTSQLSAVKNLADGYKRLAQNNMDRLTSEVDLLGKSEYEIELTKAQGEIEKRYADQTAALEQKKVGAKGATLKLINQEIANLADLKSSELDILEITKAQTFQYKQQQEEIKRFNEMALAGAAARASVEEAVAGIILGAGTKMRDEEETRANNRLPALAKRLAEIASEERKIAEAAKQRQASQFENDPEGLMAAQRDIEKAQKTATERRQQQAKETYEQQRLFVTGWEEAFQAYTENAGNAAKQAGEYFSNFSSGFENAIVKFVQTGKLSFDDLARSMIATFARIQAQNMFASLFGGGGLISSLFGGFPGKAGGGAVMAGKPYMVGENGKELFIPNSAGNIVPNGQLSGGGPVSVNYNIQAVDAASFRSLVARDPSFIYAVTEQGRRSQPSRSR